jgi:hypothetical protein
MHRSFASRRMTIQTTNMFFSDLDTDGQTDADSERQPDCRMMQRLTNAEADQATDERSDNACVVFHYLPLFSVCHSDRSEESAFLNNRFLVVPLLGMTSGKGRIVRPAAGCPTLAILKEWEHALPSYARHGRARAPVPTRAVLTSLAATHRAWPTCRRSGEPSRASQSYSFPKGFRTAPELALPSSSSRR